MDREPKKESDRVTLIGSYGDDRSWDMGSQNRNLRRAMIEQFEFDFSRALHDLQLKETIQKADVEALVGRLRKGVGELSVQNQSIISEELAIREKRTRSSQDIDR